MLPSIWLISQSFDSNSEWVQEVRYIRDILNNVVIRVIVSEKRNIIDLKDPLELFSRGFLFQIVQSES